MQATAVGELQSSDCRGPRDSERAIFAAGPRNLARATLTNESRVLMHLRLLLRRAAQPADTGDHSGGECESRFLWFRSSGTQLKIGDQRGGERDSERVACC